MAIKKTAYDTTACNGYVLKKITDTLLAAYHSGQLNSVEGFHDIKLVEGGASVVDDVPTFMHPIIFEQINAIGQIAVDVRSFGKWDNDQHVFRTRNDVEYNLAVHRAKLNHLWLTHSPFILRDISQAPIALFASWISEAVGRRFALDPREQFNLGILAAIFYSSQFTDDITLDERDKLRLINAVTKALHASAKDVIEIIDKVSVIHNVTDFCKHAEEITGSVRLKDLNVGVLYSILGSTWYGSNAKEVIAVALEHPPTWISILLYAFNERSFKNSQITKIAERSNYREIGKDFVRSVLNFVKTTDSNN